MARVVNRCRVVHGRQGEAAWDGWIDIAADAISIAMHLVFTELV
jgi:hypothetical protein